MAHINSIGAGLFSDLSVHLAAAVDTSAFGSADWFALFDNLSADEYARIKNVREFPAMGTPPNVVNVPVYGSKTSQQIQGQADAPSQELQINYIAADWASGTTLGNLVGDGIQHIFRFTLMNSEPTGTDPADLNNYASDAAGLGTVQNSQFFWVGKIEAIMVNPQLTDANTATVTLTVQSDFNGAFTI
jgi:hypothetical protein